MESADLSKISISVMPQLIDQLDCLEIDASNEPDLTGFESGEPGRVDFGFCAICLEKIDLQETALVKGCEHAYCVTCILQWASYNEKSLCPQCKNPFESLTVHRSLDGCIHDYMFEESVCLLLRASWFVPLTVGPHESAPDEPELDFNPYEFEYEHEYEYGEAEEEFDESYYYTSSSSSSIRIGNRRWGDTGYVRAGRREARPIRQSQPSLDGCDAGPSRQCNSNSINKKKEKGKEKEEVQKEITGRRAKRAMKREAADRAAAEAAAAKHQQHLQRLGRI